MSDFYVHSTDGNNGNAGTSQGAGNAWGDLAYAFAHASVVTGDRIFVAGTTKDTSFNATLASAQWMSGIKGVAVILDTNVQSTRYVIDLVHGVNGLAWELQQDCSFYGIEWEMNPAVTYTQDFIEIDWDGGTFINCKFTVNAFAASNEAYWIAGTSTSRDNGFKFFGCIFDANGSATRIALTEKSLFFDCEFLNHVNAGIGTEDAIVNVSTSYQVHFEQCRFYNNNTRAIFYTNGANLGSMISVQHCSFYFRAADSNFQYLYKNSTNQDPSVQANFIFNSCVIESDSVTSAPVLFYGPPLTGTFTGQLTGSNVWRTAHATPWDLTSYTPGTADTISTVTNYSSITPGDADFLRLASGVDALDHSFYENRDAGAYQSAASGLPAVTVSDLREGVDRGDGTLGTLVIPAVGDVRDTVAYDVAPNAKTGVLDLPLESAVQDTVVFDNATKTGTYTPTCDFPLETKVLDGISYDNGNLTGEYGAISDTATIVTQIRDNILTDIGLVLTGDGYTTLSYSYDVSKNNFKTNTKRYGCLIMDANETDEIIGSHTQDQVFEVILTQPFINGKLTERNDDAQVAAVDELSATITKISRRLQQTKAGSVGQVINVTDAKILETEFLDDDNVAVLRLQLTVKYRQTFV